MRASHRVVMRGGSGRDGSPVRRGGVGGMRLVVALGVLVALYFVVGGLRAEIVERFPAAYPFLRAFGFDVAEPRGYGLELRGAVARGSDGGQFAIEVRGYVRNTLSTRQRVPRIVVRVTSRNARPMEWTIEPSLSSLAPGQRLDFSARYPTPYALIDYRGTFHFEER